MSLAPKTAANSVADREARQQASPERFQAMPATMTALQERCSTLREQRHFLSASRQSFQQERLLLWQYSQELRPETSTPSQPSVQERQEAFEEFQQRLQHQGEAFEVSQQVFEDKLHILREQRKTVLAIPDPVQRHQAFHQLQAEYQQLQQEVREQKLLLREQRATYHQLRGDYEVSTGNCMLRDSSDSNGRKSDAGNGLVTRERFIVFCLAAGIQEQKKERQQGALKSAGRNRCLDMT